MSPRYARRPRVTAPPALSAAGWLFAELAMVLVVVAFGSQSGPGPAAEPAPEPPAPTTTTEVPESQGPEGLSLNTTTFVIPVPPDGAGAADAFRREIDARVGDGRVGLTLLFGVSRDGEPLHGQQVSQLLKDVIAPLDIPQMRSNAETRPYVGGHDDGQPGEVKVELFVFTGTD